MTRGSRCLCRHCRHNTRPRHIELNQLSVNFVAEGGASVFRDFLQEWAPAAASHVPSRPRDDVPDRTVSEAGLIFGLPPHVCFYMKIIDLSTGRLRVFGGASGDYLTACNARWSIRSVRACVCVPLSSRRRWKLTKPSSTWVWGEIDNLDKERECGR